MLGLYSGMLKLLKLQVELLQIRTLCWDVLAGARLPSSARPLHAFFFIRTSNIRRRLGCS